MSDFSGFTERANAILIYTGDLHSTPTPISEEPSLTGDGWDGLTIRYVLRTALWTAEQVATAFPIGARLGSRNFWIVGAKPVQLAAGLWAADVSFKGWASDKPALIKVGSSANQQSGSNVRAPAHVGDTGGTIYAKVETHENMPDITISYLVSNVSTSSRTGDVGTAQTPPVTIDVPATVWSFLTDFVYHWPNGWVLMASEQDRLPGTTVGLVTDTYKYIREKTPG